jgi:hypothetical protein
MSKFVMKSKATKEAAKKAKEKGGGFSNFKISKTTHRLLILGPIEDRPAIFTSVIHELWKNKRPVARVASPSFSGQPDKISKMGWAIRDAYKESSNTKKKEYFRNFLPKENHYVNVLDLDDIDAGPQVYQMSGAVAEVVLDEITDCDGDLTSICDFDEGRILQVRHNGKTGLQRRYKAKFLADTANLIEDGILTDEDIDDIADKMSDLTKMQPKFDQDAFDELYEKLLKAADKNGIDVNAGEEDDDDYEEDDSDNDEFEDEDDDFSDEIDDDDDEFGEDDDESGDDDFEDDFDIDDDDDEEDEPAPKKSRSKKAPAKKRPTSKKASSSKGTVRKKRRRG